MEISLILADSVSHSDQHFICISAEGPLGSLLTVFHRLLLTPVYVCFPPKIIFCGSDDIVC